ncbi:hypothetical protein GA0070624_3835 [Micromonospora rhizosphaerae]|uniref:Uncharacterized protein n=1 Tax=Micromonospora rhizosphaerae TaxID=568872 RepID=A0A1C6SI74_9ACTN|nr:hypothetical protein [Micromonospora rhizosphaerae]SCL29186.1 hypothetical protein GA0070624_3835 [Micromonospora rhizosphaerae]
MSRRAGQLTRVALRLGLLLGGVVCAWSVYEAATGHIAYAHDAPPAISADGTVHWAAGHVWTPHSPVVRDIADRKKACDRSAPVTGRIGKAAGTKQPWASTSQRSGPQSHSRPRPKAAETSDRLDPDAAPAQRAAPPRWAAAKSGSQQAKPASPKTKPVVAKVVAPVSADAEPGTDPKKPRKGGKVDPRADQAKSPHRQATRTSTRVGHSTTVGLTARPTAARGWSVAGDDAGGPPVPHPVRPDVAPEAAAPGVPSSVGSGGSVYGSAADTSAGAWTPPALRGHRCRPTRSAALSSRSPRPGTRPA